MKIGCAIAKMASTSTQAVIARLEGGGSKPRLQALDTHLERYAEAMGSRLRITFEPESARP
jgi:predicted transcriptional regulator